MVKFPVTTVVFRLTVPEKPLLLVTLTVDVPEEPAVIVIALGLAVMTKSGVVLVEKMAVCTVSGTGLVEPFAIATQVVVPETLVDVQPVWYPMGVPDVVPVTLYIAVNNRPVVGGKVSWPRAPTAANSSVSAFPGQTVPTMIAPPMHSDMMVVGVGSTVPVRSMPAGRKTV